MEVTLQDSLQGDPQEYADKITEAARAVLVSTNLSAVRFASDLNYGHPTNELVLGVTLKTLVEGQTSKSDPFTIRDGHFVGHDGFVVPRDFGEFYKRFPNYVPNWVRKHADRFATDEDLKDWTNDLLLHLSNLPEKSKHRQAGKKDTVQTFDPAKHYGANQARFWNYINLCLMNKFRSMRSKRIKDALFRPGNVSLGGQIGGEDLRSVDDEYCHSNSTHLQEAAKIAEKEAHDRARLQEFEDFVWRHDPKVLPAIKALLATGSQGDAANWLGITERESGRMLWRLRQLGKCFRDGVPVPRQRKPYKKRIARNGALLGLSVGSLKV